MAWILPAAAAVGSLSATFNPEIVNALTWAVLRSRSVMTTSTPTRAILKSTPIAGSR